MHSTKQAAKLGGIVIAALVSHFTLAFMSSIFGEESQVETVRHASAIRTDATVIRGK